MTRLVSDLQILLKEAKLSGLVLLRSFHRPEKVPVRLQNPENLDFQDCYQPSNHNSDCLPYPHHDYHS